MSEQTIAARHGLWHSAQTVEQWLAQPAAPSYPFWFDGRLHWLEARAREGGRIALMRESTRGARQCITPAEFNLRSGVHEYGGKCFCIVDNAIVFNNFADGRLYRQSLAHPRPLQVEPLHAVTVANDGAGGNQSVGQSHNQSDGRSNSHSNSNSDNQSNNRSAGQNDGNSNSDSANSNAPQHSRAFADLVALPNANAVLAVMETQTANGAQDALVAVPLSTEGDAEPQVLRSGADFYAAIVASPDGKRVAWLEWNHPFMPWDCTRLYVAELHCNAGRFTLGEAQCIAGADDGARAVCQPGFLADGSLLFLVDDAANDFWNFFQYQNGHTLQITDDQYDYGEPHWQFGQRRWVQVDDKVLAIAGTLEGDHMRWIDVRARKSSDAIGAIAGCYHLHDAAVDADALLWVAADEARNATIATWQWRQTTTVQLGAPAVPARQLDCTPPRAIEFATRDGECAHAYFYPPHNPRYQPPEGVKPPLLTVVHGGPTARATNEYHPLKHYFASLGYAVLDINHRGSSGYGRAYRQRLLGRWGEIDADDIADGVRYVLQQNWADPKLVFIRGGSAGGYAVLRALTRFPELFCGGACYYGIGNLITLAQITHKFENCYTDRLIGERYDEASASLPHSRFVQRSPIFHLDKLSCPLILFQGRDDKVVPPAVSREVVAKLAEKNIRHEYIEYENEAHGFRKMPTRIDALNRETAFFAEIIRTRRG